MKNSKFFSFLLILLLVGSMMSYAADDQFADEQARDNLQMSLLDFQSKNDSFSVSEDEINVYRIAQGKTMRMSITLFMMSMYGIVISGDNSVEEIKVEIINEDGDVILNQIMGRQKMEAIMLNAEYTGEYVINITPTKIKADDDDFFKTAFISWAVLYED